MKKQEFLAELWKQLSDAPKEDVERSLDYYTEMIEDRIEAGMSEEEAVADIGSPKDAAKQIMDELPKTRPAGVFRDRTAETAGSGSSQVQSGPVHSGQVQSGPAQSGPVKSGPVQGGPAQNRSAGNASAYAGSRNTAEYNAAYDEQMDRMMNRTPEKPQKKSSGGKLILLICLFPFWLPLLITVASLIFAFFVTLWSLTIALFAVAGGFILAGIAGAVSLIINAIHGEFAIGLVHAGAGFILSGLAIFFFMISSNIVKGTARVSAAIWRKITGFFRGKETTV